MVDQTRGSGQGQGTPFSTLGTGHSNVNYNTTTVQLSNQLKDGVEAIVITKDRQSSQPQIWATGDPQQAQQLYRQFSQQFDMEGVGG